jgi:hypothetical protein
VDFPTPPFAEDTAIICDTPVIFERAGRPRENRGSVGAGRGGRFCAIRLDTIREGSCVGDMGLNVLCD